MKTSHYKTPRTIAECEFTVGYPIVDIERNNVKLVMTALIICGAYVVLPIMLILFLLNV
jgi:hypothetical protein